MLNFSVVLFAFCLFTHWRRYGLILIMNTCNTLLTKEKMARQTRCRKWRCAEFWRVPLRDYLLVMKLCSLCIEIGKLQRTNRIAKANLPQRDIELNGETTKVDVLDCYVALFHHEYFVAELHCQKLLAHSVPEDRYCRCLYDFGFK